MIVYLKVNLRVLDALPGPSTQSLQSFKAHAFVTRIRKSRRVLYRIRTKVKLVLYIIARIL